MLANGRSESGSGVVEVVRRKGMQFSFGLNRRIGDKMNWRKTW